MAAVVSKNVLDVSTLDVHSNAIKLWVKNQIIDMFVGIDWAISKIALLIPFVLVVPVYMGLALLGDYSRTYARASVSRVRVFGSILVGVVFILLHLSIYTEDIVQQPDWASSPWLSVIFFVGMFWAAAYNGLLRKGA